MEAITREEQFMAAAAGQAVELPEPITRREKFLKAIAERGGGAQPDMAQNDPTQPDYVKNRTHYDDRRPGEIKIEYNGSLDGYIYLEGMVKVSDLTPTADELVGGVLTLLVPNNIEKHTIEAADIIHKDNMLTVYSQNMIVFTGDSGIPKGIWFRRYDDNNAGLCYTMSLSYTGTVGELKKLDEKYLPDSVQNKTYRFYGYRDIDTDNGYILEKGEWMECMDMLLAGECDTIEVLDTTTVAPRIFSLTGSRSGEGGEILQFQKIQFDTSNSNSITKVVGELIEIAIDGARYLELPYAPVPG